MNVDNQYDGQSAAASRGLPTQSQSATPDFPPLGSQLNGQYRRQAPGLNGLGQMNGQADQVSDSGSLDGLSTAKHLPTRQALSPVVALRSPSESFRTPNPIQEAQEVRLSNARTISKLILPFRHSRDSSREPRTTLHHSINNTCPFGRTRRLLSNNKLQSAKANQILLRSNNNNTSHSRHSNLSTLTTKSATSRRRQLNSRTSRGSYRK